MRPYPSDLRTVQDVASGVENAAVNTTFAPRALLRRQTVTVELTPFELSSAD
jgi:hypothetical protein